MMMMTRASLLLRSLLPAALCLVPQVAAADPVSPAERTLARSLFEQARTLAHAGNYADACPKFEESGRLAPGIGTAFNLGDCFEHVGRPASAWSAFTDAADQARRAGQDDREAAARARAAALEPKLAKIVLNTAPPLPVDFTVTLDGKVLSAAVLRAPLPIDPGEHVIRASAPGKVSSDLTIHVAAIARTESIEIAPLSDLPPPAPAASTTIIAPVSTPAETGQPYFGWQRTSAVAAGGLAIVGVALGSYFAAHASSQWSDAKADCAGTQCSAAGYQGWQDSRTSAAASTGLFISAGVLAVGGVILWVTAPKPSSAQERKQARNEVQP
jgi:hypothetical protein